ncbi:DUF3300 domain-containing protein [Roseicella sp. DB1501]|uniref:DUF3300 domain-containing protein n=1 Tax=Roseicella sp. DB1501 TaxID=2730925 RepID=UPI001492458A|nr:DUF3300 domain-containing protein [Roseicella sp. DB1501]NOG69108.1 DUF3300 domain-containing protein [Roseicella sp. DB1501]
MPRPWQGLLPGLVMLVMAIPAAVPAWAQGSVAPVGSPGAVSAAGSQALSAEALDRLLEPFAGAPQDSLGIVLDAGRYPNDLIEASLWARTPEASRGAVKESWAPTVRILAERAPQTLDYLTRDLATTAALGSAYGSQPNDVWLAYGRVTERHARVQAQLQKEPVPATEARPAGSDRARSSDGPHRAPASAPPAAAPAPSASAPAAPPQAVVVPPPPATGPSPAGAALAGGAIGLGAGLLISELAHDNDGWGYPGPYGVPPPYMPYGGGNAAGLQANRIAAASNLQNNRVAAASNLQANRQSFEAAQRQQQQAATSQRQAQRQSAQAARQAQRQQATTTGAQRRAAAIAGQHPLTGNAARRPRPGAPEPAFQGAIHHSGWGPTRGMSDAMAASRARVPTAGFHGRGGMRRR